ncbi:hypothetical protein NP493_154g03001 [Ridgeia piscesae]|uniref:Egal-1 winged helix domain-containing protein n=1 Tax=Ridgeia piscesae TaxID=27915 RepID=A0AAD9UFQ1_RIDPI|nr:hypothetical protein NP493_154g03001 [Ridgeia piscesae]
MSDDPSHKAMLFFLEVLMNSNGPLTISQLAGRFGSRNFTMDMRTACGGNEAGLKKFLQKFPSLLTVRGNLVSLFNASDKGGNILDSDASSSPESTRPVRPLPDISAEMDAVKYFQSRLLKRDEKWLQIKRVAGHLSQAPFHIRNAVGPQLGFRDWLLKHPHIFEVQGELVGLRDGIAAISPDVGASTRRATFDMLNGSTPSATASTNVRKSSLGSSGSLRRSHSFSEKRALALQAQQGEGQGFTRPNVSAVRKRDAPVTMTANEYKAVMFLKDVIEKKNGNLPLQGITEFFSQASEGVRNTIGWSKAEVLAFLKKNSNVFTVSNDEFVDVVKNAKLNVVITGSRPQSQHGGTGIRTLTARSGCVYHVAKLWGIIDLGKHEHVFFDRSIMVKPMDDLQKIYKVGEVLFFNAVLAPKASRAKWKAIRVWKCGEQNSPGSMTSSKSDSNLSSTGDPMSPAGSVVEEEMNQFFDGDDNAKTDNGKFSDAPPSGAGAVPVWNFKVQGKSDRGDKPTMVPESYYMSASSLSDVQKQNTEKPTTNGVVGKTQKYNEVACQTVSTGDIIATQLYEER